MKKLLCLLFIFAFVFNITACEGNFAQVDLSAPISISEDGITEKNVLDKLKSENAIGTFTGQSGDFKYEWIVFGSDINETKDVNFSIEIGKTEKGVKVKFNQKEDFGFPALLSIYLNEKWTINSASAYADGNIVYSVSVTGSKTSILNISINKIIDVCEILPDETNQDTPTTTDAPGNITQSEASTPTNKVDDYLSDSKDNDDNRVYSDGQSSLKDKYETDPVPEGKPMPVEPENQEVDKGKKYTCYFSIECSTILNNLQDLDPDKRELVPSNGVILPLTKVTFYEGESVFDVLQRVCKENNIHMESSWTPIYNSAYIEGIHNLYEFDCGALSGWMYRVDGWYPNYGCSRYQLKDGEKVEWRYTCDLGKDVGCDWLAGS